MALELVSSRPARAVGLWAALLFVWAGTAAASQKQEIYVTGTVESFGGYTFTEGLQFTVKEPGQKNLGAITVEGLYNGEYPWIMRIYTDNLHFAGVAGAIRRPGPAGLISQDAKYSVLLEVSCPNFGPGQWRRIPDLNEPGFRPYQPSVEPGEAAPNTDCILMGIDPRNANWVAGPDGVLYTDDDNLLGDTTLKTPFDISFRADFPPSSAQGTYEALLYVEIVPAP